MNTTSPCEWPSPENRIRDLSGVPSLISFDCVTTSWRTCVFYRSTEAVKKVNIAVWARKRTSFGDTTDSMTERTLKLHGHASMRHTLRSLPVTATTRQAIAIELRLAIRTVDIARPRYGSKSKTGTTECLVEISVHRFHTDSHRETLVAGLLRFRTQRPAEVDGGSFRSEGIGKRLRQGLRLLWMAPRRQMYHSNR